MNKDLLRFCFAPEGGEGGGAPVAGNPASNDPTPNPTHVDGEDGGQPQEEQISKALYDKLASEYAKYKKDMKAKERANMTAQELKNAEAEDFRKELETLKKENAKSKAISKLNKIQGNDETIESIAQALVDNDMESVINNVLKLVESATSEANKRVETMQLESTRRPNIGDNSSPTQITVKEFKQMTIDERIKLKVENPELYATLSNQNN